MGVQGVGKSAALRTLVPDPAWFAEDLSPLGTKDAAQDLCGKWIIEMAELSALRRGEVETVKAFISKRVDHYRPSYGRRAQDFALQCVFAGTTNEDQPLKDETGNRRFWPVAVGKIDLEALARDRDQLWAEAMHEFRAGKPWFLSAEAATQARDAQAQRLAGDVWEEVVAEYAAELTEVTVAELLVGAIEKPIGQWTKADEMRIAAILRRRGWTKACRGALRQGTKVNLWTAPPPPRPEDGGGGGGGGAKTDLSGSSLDTPPSPPPPPSPISIHENGSGDVVCDESGPALALNTHIKPVAEVGKATERSNCA